MKIELKPCPFCGGEAEIVPEGDYHEIVCEHCQLSMWAHAYDEIEIAWNRRTYED